MVTGPTGLIVATGSGLTVTVMFADTGPQGPAGSFVVRVNTTLPVVIVGVYVVLNEFALANVPLGADHVADVALPPITPFKFTTFPTQTA